MSLTSKANEVVEIAEKLRKRLEKFDELYHTLGKAINNVITAYDKSVIPTIEIKRCIKRY